MTIIDKIKGMFQKKEPEVYTPQREAIDRRHDNLQRQMSFYKKKYEIPIMERKIKEYEKRVYGDGFKTRDENNILKVPNYFKQQNNFKLQKRRGMIWVEH